jgi:hypothetical protein
VLKNSRKLLGLLAASGLAAAWTVAGGMSVAAASAATCSGGSVAPGMYASLTIAGFCAIDSGDVTVQDNLTIEPHAGLLAAFSGSNLTVGGSLNVNTGLLVLGCEPQAFPCFNDPNQQTGTRGFQTSHRVGEGLQASGAILMLVHHSTIFDGVSQVGGGGGVPCQLLPFGPPAYTTYEDNTIHGDVNVSGLHTCWDGFFRNTVFGNVSWNGNITWDGTLPDFPPVNGDDDGNEIANNTIHGDLTCVGNTPAMQFGDSGGTPSTVFGDATGQCAPGPLVIVKGGS